RRRSARPRRRSGGGLAGARGDPAARTAPAGSSAAARRAPPRGLPAPPAPPPKRRPARASAPNPRPSVRARRRTYRPIPSPRSIGAEPKDRRPEGDLVGPERGPLAPRTVRANRGSRNVHSHGLAKLRDRDLNRGSGADET